MFFNLIAVLFRYLRIKEMVVFIYFVCVTLHIRIQQGGAFSSALFSEYLIDISFHDSTAFAENTEVDVFFFAVALN